MNKYRELAEEPQIHEGMSVDEEGAVLLLDTLKTLLRWEVEIVTFKDKFYVVRK